MSVQSVLIPSDAMRGFRVAGFEEPMREVKLGARLRPEVPKKVPRLRAFLDAQAAPEPPPVVDYHSGAMASLSQMLMNDRLGCCVISGKAHIAGANTLNDTTAGAPVGVLATDQEVVSAYRSICGHLGSDSGCYIDEVFDRWMNPGIQFGGQVTKIDGYAAVDHTNVREAKIALYLFGALTIGMSLPQSWANNARPGFTWDITNSGIVGGHDVALVGYDETGFKVSTWGVVGTITYRAFQAQNWVSECYAAAGPLWWGQDKVSGMGLNADALIAAFKQLKDTGDVVIPEPTPVPPVVPPPVPPPVQYPTYAVSLKGPLGMTFSGTAIPTGVDRPFKVIHTAAAFTIPPWLLAWLTSEGLAVAKVVIQGIAAGKTFQQIVLDVLKELIPHAVIPQAATLPCQGVAGFPGWLTLLRDFRAVLDAVKAYRENANDQTLGVLIQAVRKLVADVTGG